MVYEKLQHINMVSGYSITASERRLFESIATKKCCSNYCLIRKCNNPPGGMNNSVRLIKQCRGELEGKTYKKKYYFVEQIVRNACVRLSDSNIWDMNFVIGTVFDYLSNYSNRLLYSIA